MLDVYAHGTAAHASPISDESRLMAVAAEEMGKVIVGQRAMLDRLFIALLADGHVLLEGVPGLAKTLAVRTMAATIAGGFHRIQFTPDLLPSDLIGTLIYNQRSGDFSVQKGPIFANILLADEINRAPAKVQSALLEAMQEKQVTIGGQTFPLPDLFLVLATQNPIEHEGTYPLPESQLDRFLMRIAMGYPGRDAELAMLESQGPDSLVADDLSPVVDADDVATMATIAQSVHVAPSLRSYVVDLAEATRRHPMLSLGVSPRATLGLQRAARAWAAADGREYIVPDDLKAIAGPVLGHRLVLTPEAQLQGMGSVDVLEQVLASVPVPASRAG
jgi:MoxR-like ATPase